MRTSVLLVEDDARIREALGLALDDEDFDVVPAPSREEALARLRETRVDVVLLDLMLPGIDGRFEAIPRSPMWSDRPRRSRR